MNDPITIDEMNYPSDDLIYLRNAAGEDIAFMPIAQIPLDAKLYLILKPLAPLVSAMGPNEALVFERAADGAFVVVCDMDVIDRVFDIYEQLVENSGN